MRVTCGVSEVKEEEVSLTRLSPRPSTGLLGSTSSPLALVLALGCHAASGGGYDLQFLPS